MKFFDLHCDTIMRIIEEGLDFASDSDLHVNLNGLEASNTIVQVFACFVHDANYPGRCFEACDKYIDSIENLVRAHGDRLVQVRNSQELGKVEDRENRTGVIVAIEGAAPLMGNPENLEHFYRRGVRVLTIAWDDNEFCGTVFGSKTGLTESGKTLVRLCHDLGIVVDVSHASDIGFYDIAAIADSPFVATHSNARAVCPNERNLTDDMIAVIARRGGIIGLTYGSGFISPEYYSREKAVRDKILAKMKRGEINFQQAGRISREALSDLEPARIAQLVDHALHIINKGGEDCLALGSDFDGVDSLPYGITGTGSLDMLVDEMQRRKIASRIIDKICCVNAFRFFNEAMA
jgi:membrane dipeptidase